jgi:hydrogenase expression/formation protein HypC
MCLAVPGCIQSISGADELRSGRVSFGGIVKEVNLAYVPEVKEGDYVLVHAGFAITVVDEAEAAQTLEYLRQIGQAEELSARYARFAEILKEIKPTDWRAADETETNDTPEGQG